MKCSQHMKPRGDWKYYRTARLAPESAQSYLRACSCDRTIAILFLGDSDLRHPCPRPPHELVLGKRRDGIWPRMVLNALIHRELTRLDFYILQYETFFFFMFVDLIVFGKWPITVNRLNDATERNEVLRRGRQGGLLYNVPALAL